jgi:hypothetical protein
VVQQFSDVIENFSDVIENFSDVSANFSHVIKNFSDPTESLWINAQIFGIEPWTFLIAVKRPSDQMRSALISNL